MGKKKEKENLAEELAKSFERWEYLKEHGGSDPFYADGGVSGVLCPVCRTDDEDHE